MNKIIFKLFGAFSVFINEEPLTELRLMKAKALLAYLSSEPEQIYSRDVLMTLLWPESSANQARNNLRIALYRIRDALNSTESGLSDLLLNVTRHSLQFNLDANTEVDLIKFQQLIKNVSHHQHISIDECTECQQHLSTMTELYRGDFLSGMESLDAQPFEEWLLVQRESLRQQFLITLSDLATVYERAGDYGTSHRYASQQLQIDPYNEEAHRHIMRSLAEQGLREEAKSHFTRMKALLAEELGVEPEDDTVELHDAISIGEIKDGSQSSDAASTYRPKASATERDRPMAAEQERADWDGHTQTPKELIYPTLSQDIIDEIDATPLLGTRFGYQYEENRLHEWLSSGDCHIVALLGMVGSGKTSLAASVAEQLKSQFDRVIWRSVRDASPPSAFFAGILHALTGLPVNQLPTSADELLHSLLRQFKQQRVLLILDDFEHLLDQQNAGIYRAKCEAYGQLLDLFVGWEQNSHLLFISRNIPASFRRLEEENPLVRSLELEGLDIEGAVALLDHLGSVGPPSEKRALAERYAGNPLALKVAVDAADNLYQGNLSPLLTDETAFFGVFRHGLAQQVNGLSEDEALLFAFVAAADQPVNYSIIEAEFRPTWSQGQLIEVVQSLQNRLLIEPASANEPAFSTQYITAAYTQQLQNLCR